ncbi:hypothetical protein QTP86_030060 [Hemibagrus guttatus]|nr:hypothetical protein QTP86_030060 [Hemibagrus guttatus]
MLVNLDMDPPSQSGLLQLQPGTRPNCSVSSTQLRSSECDHSLYPWSESRRLVVLTDAVDGSVWRPVSRRQPWTEPFWDYNTVTDLLLHLTVVRCAVGQTEEFKVEVGLHQGSALSPFLFAMVMDQLSEEVRQESPWTMMFADDIVICSESREQVEENLERWRFALERRGMKVSRSKTEYMCVNEREGSGTVRLQGEEVKKGLVIRDGAIPKPGSDAAAQDALNGPSVQHGQDGGRFSYLSDQPLHHCHLPPPGPLGNFLDEMDTLLSVFPSDSTPLTVLGDFNLPSDKLHSSGLLALLNSFSLSFNSCPPQTRKETSWI